MAEVSNEIIIAALLSKGTIKEAAAEIGITTRTVYDRMKKIDFVAEYTAAKNNIISNAVVATNSRLNKAFETTEAIMTDEEVNPAIRLQAAQTIITNSCKFIALMKDADAAYLRDHVPMSFSDFSF